MIKIIYISECYLRKRADTPENMRNVKVKLLKYL